ncbi:hypothetical protein NECAME_09245 [Necator americanus]|uniref:Secreted protein n=1 Tax=Necator americanus TaxID=51031 RepID=W2TGP6_NECAM|nr:hypothetical protein NECAME_09245 [Necator americanus]ETN80351.1 hypothetical protein NECAME_09245 [Necator americanus]
MLLRWWLWSSSVCCCRALGHSPEAEECVCDPRRRRLFDLRFDRGEPPPQHCSTRAIVHLTGIFYWLVKFNYFYLKHADHLQPFIVVMQDMLSEEQIVPSHLVPSRSQVDGTTIPSHLNGDVNGINASLQYPPEYREG